MVKRLAHISYHVIVVLMSAALAQDTNVPEYDLDTDELVYRDRMGNEVLRERFLGER